MPAPAAQNRQNEYFVPRDGIDREVITADICRYLGNDALVRPGTYEVRTLCSALLCAALRCRAGIRNHGCRYCDNNICSRINLPQDKGRVIQGYYITAYRNLTSVSRASGQRPAAKQVHLANQVLPRRR